MADDTPQKELLQEMSRLFKRFEKGGDLAPIEDRDEWDKLVESKPPEERELVKELARFVGIAGQHQLPETIAGLHPLPGLHQ